MVQGRIDALQGRVDALQGSQVHTHRMVTPSLALPTAAPMALLHIGGNASIT